MLSSVEIGADMMKCFRIRTAQPSGSSFSSHALECLVAHCTHHKSYLLIEDLAMYSSSSARCIPSAFVNKALFIAA